MKFQTFLAIDFLTDLEQMKMMIERRYQSIDLNLLAINRTIDNAEIMEIGIAQMVRKSKEGEE